MDDDRDRFLNKIARDLRAGHVDPSVDSRIMSAVKHTGEARWPRLLMPRRFTITPLPWSLAAAAALLVAALLGAGVARQPAWLLRFTASAQPHGRDIQFVLVAPEAKKVAVVGDFNAWDVSHSAFQARHKGGGVWTVTAQVPAGHHRYSFVVDDSVWMADPMAPRANDHDFGLPKSALVVGSDQ